MHARNIGLDLPRAAAITLVVASHYVSHYPLLGVYGVELFFALSGFLIGGILYRELAAPGDWTLPRVKRFWLRRWYRTLPNYYLFLGVAVVFHAFYGGLPSPGGFLPYLVFAQTI